MAERTVNIGLASYRRADGPEDTALWGFALQGEVVDVHEDDLERFDRLNGPQATDQPPLAEVPEPAVDAAGDPQEPPRSGKGSGVEAWAEYAASLDIEVPEGASRDEIVELVDGRS